jgi:hypothetical protein
MSRDFLMAAEEVKQQKWSKVWLEVPISGLKLL